MAPNLHRLARAVIVDSGRILLVRARRRDGTAFHFLPGGHMEGEETPGETIIRELREEGGIGEVIIGRLLDTHGETWDNNGEPYHEINWFVAVSIPTVYSAVAPVSLEPHIAFEWRSVGDLGTLFPPVLRQWVPQWATAQDVDRPSTG